VDFATIHRMLFSRQFNRVVDEERGFSIAHQATNWHLHIQKRRGVERKMRVSYSFLTIPMIFI